MKIDRIHIEAFGGLENVEINFKPEMQIVYGMNESGKTTIQNFIKAMFYGFGKIGHSVETNARKKYKPWSGKTMGGYIVFSYHGITYRLAKRFAERKSQDETWLSLEASGEPVNLKNPEQPGQELFQISEIEFLNTVFVENPGVDSENLSELDPKINRKVGLSEYDWSYEEINARLEKARKYYKPDRGNEGYLAGIEQKIADLNLNLEQALNRDQQVADLNKNIEVIETELIELADREYSLLLQNQQHQKLKLAERFEKYQKLQESLDRYMDSAANVSEGVLRNKLISAKELTEIANQRQLTMQALSEYEIRFNIAEQRFLEQENYHNEAKRTVSEIVAERSRLQYLQQKSAEHKPQTFSKPKISYASFIPLVIAEIFCLIGGLIFRATKPVLSGFLIVLAVLLPFIMVFIYYFLQRKHDYMMKQYHEKIRKHEIRTLKIENGLQKLEWQLEQIDQRIKQLNGDQKKAAEAAEYAEQQYQKEFNKLKYLIKPYFLELPDDDQLDLAIQSLREQTVNSIQNEEEIKRTKEQMNELKGSYDTAQFYQAYQDAQNWLIEKQSELRTFPEFSEKYIDSQLAGIQESRIILREKLATEKTKLNHLIRNQINTIELEAELNRLITVHQKAEQNYAALLMSLHLLHHSKAKFDEDVRPVLNQKAAEYLSAMTGSQYQELKIDQDYVVRLQPETDNNVHYYEQAFYSAGLNDQINLALRLALTELLQDMSESIPLILDDPFIQLDQNRATLSLELLLNLSKSQKRQIILFTSQKSLVNLADGTIELINL
ncbi:MAG TPA: AAA family ATPase [Clostridiaceae bacterium]|nr:AAA family ATPase [Clostridiaceae bacterium]